MHILKFSIANTTTQHSVAWELACVIQVELASLEMVSETMHCVYGLRGEKRKKSTLRKSEKEFGDQ